MCICINVEDIAVKILASKFIVIMEIMRNITGVSFLDTRYLMSLLREGYPLKFRHDIWAEKIRMMGSY